MPVEESISYDEAKKQAKASGYKVDEYIELLKNKGIKIKSEQESISNDEAKKQAKASGYKVDEYIELLKNKGIKIKSEQDFTTPTEPLSKSGEEDKYGMPVKKKDQSEQDFTTRTEPLSKSGEEDKTYFEFGQDYDDDKETRTRNFVELKQDYDEDQAQSIDIISNIFENKGIEEDYPVSEWGDEYLTKLEKNKAALEEAVKQHQRNLSPLAEEYDVSAERMAQSTFNVDKWLLNKESGKILEESSIAFKEYYLSKNPEAKKILESDSSTEEQVDEVVQDIYNQWTKQPEELAGLDIYKKEGREADLFTTDAGEFTTALGSIADAFEAGVDDADYSKKLTGELSFATDDEQKVILDKLYRKSLYEAKKVQDVGDDIFSAEGFSGMLGSQRDALVGSMLLAAIPIPGLNVAASMLYSGQDAARASYGTAMSQTFNEARNEGFSVEEAFSKAKKQAVVEATGGFIEGVAGAGTSGLANRFGIAVSKKFASKPISFLVNQAAEGLSDVGLDGSVAAINQIASNLSKNLMGIDTDMFSGVPDAIIGEMLFSGVFKVPGTVKTSADLRRFVKSLPRAEQQKIFQDFVDAKKSMDSKITNDRANQYIKLQKDQAKSEKNFSLEKQIDKDPVGHLINERDRLNTLFEGMSTDKGKAQVKENIDAINTMIKNMEGYTVTDADGNTQVVSRKDLAKSIEDPKFIDAVAQGDIDVTIDNDNELSQLLFSKIDALTKTEEDAVQEQKPDEVPVQPEVEAGKEVEGEVPESRPEEPTKEVKEVKQEEGVKPTIAGKKLFNDPNPETLSISQEYKSDNKIEEGDGEPITSLDEDNSKEIADAYDEMKHDPDNPEVKESYNAMAKETVDQHNKIAEKGYVFEVYEGKGEPYKNSAEMIADIRDNKHLYILATENEFGDAKITDQQRSENPLLADSGIKDVNGRSLLVNDVFRGVHDFFGHSERGNGFGAVGEENAWDVHARMYTPKARRAMTTETRGQNSWVNFGKQMRNDDGSIKKKGDEGYMSPTERPFAEQKIGLLPESYSQIIQTKEGKQPTKKQKVKPTTIKKQNVSDVDAIVGRAKNEEQKSALATISNVVKALTGIDKDVEVIVHEDADSYNAEVERQGGDPTDVSSGFFDNGSQIHINASEVQNTTAFHEGGHKVIASYVKRTPGAVDKFKSQLESKIPKKDVDSLNEFVSEYDSEEQSEEFVTEALARIASGDIKLDKSALDKIKDYLRGLAKSLGMDPDMIKLTGKEDVQDFARKLSEAFTEGKEIKILENLKNEVSVEPTVVTSLSTKSPEIKMPEVAPKKEKFIPKSPKLQKKKKPKAKTATQKKIDKTVGVSKPRTWIKMTEKSALDKQIKDISKGAKIGAKATKEAISNVQDKLVSYVDLMVEDLDISPAVNRQIRYMIRKATDKNIDTLIERVDKKIQTSINNKKKDIKKDITNIVSNKKSILKKVGKKWVGKVPPNIQEYIADFDLKSIELMDINELQSTLNDIKNILKEGVKEVKLAEANVRANKRREQARFFEAIRETSEGKEQVVSGKENILNALSVGNKAVIIDGQLISRKTAFKEVTKGKEFDFDNITVYTIVPMSHVRQNESNTRRTLAWLNPFTAKNNLRNAMIPVIKGSKVLRKTYESLMDDISDADFNMEEEVYMKKKEYINRIKQIFGTRSRQNALRELGRLSEVNPFDTIEDAPTRSTMVNLYNIARSGDPQKNDDGSIKKDKNGITVTDGYLELEESIDADGINQIFKYIEGDSKLKQYSDYLLNEFYPSMKEDYESTYEFLTGTLFPGGVYYPRFADVKDGELIDSGDIMDDKGAVNYRSAVAGNLKQRVNHNLKVNTTIGSHEVAMNYIESMSRARHFIPVGEKVNTLFSDVGSAEMAKKIGTVEFNSLKDHLAVVITGQDPRAGKRDNFDKTISVLMGIKIFGSLAGKIASIPKQLTSFTHFSSAKGVKLKDWINGFVPKNKEELDLIRKIWTSNYVKRRVAGRSLDIEINKVITDDRFNDVNQAQRLTSKVLMSALTTGDIGGVLAGGTPFAVAVYRQERSKGKSHEDAMSTAYRRFATESETAQQSSRATETSHMQRNKVGRLFSSFTTSQTQTTNKLKESVRMLMSDTELSNEEKTHHLYNIMYYSVANVGFAMVANGMIQALWAGWEDEDDKNKDIYNTLVDNTQSILNGIGMTGVVVNFAINQLRGDEWKNTIPVLQSITNVAESGSTAVEMLMQGKSWEELTPAEKNKIYKAIPVDGIRKQTENFKKFAEGEKGFDEAIFNWASKKEQAGYKPKKDVIYESIFKRPYTKSKKRSGVERMKVSK